MFRVEPVELTKTIKQKVDLEKSIIFYDLSFIPINKTISLRIIKIIIS